MLLSSDALAWGEQRYFSFGLLRANFARSDIYIEQDRYDRDVVYRQVEARDDLRMRLLDGYHFTQLQFYFRLGVEFRSKQFAELSLSHLTYIVHRGQSVRKVGEWDGDDVDQVIRLGQDLRQFEHSNGINVLSLYWLREYELVDDSGIGVMAQTRMGPGLALVNSNNEIYDPDGAVEKYESHKAIHLGGAQLAVGAGLKLHLPMNTYLELSSEAAYMKISHFKVEHGRGKQDLFYLTGALQTGFYF